MKWKRSQEGYLIINNGMGPGVSEDLAIQAGKDPANVIGLGIKSIFESATITCSHCHVIVVLNPNRTRPRNYCAKCDHYVCDNPVCNKECQPLTMVLDMVQNAIEHHPHIEPKINDINLNQLDEPVKEQIKKIITG